MLILCQKMSEGGFWVDLKVPEVRDTSAPPTHYLDSPKRIATVDEWGQMLAKTETAGTFRGVTQDGRIHNLVVSARIVYEYVVTIG